MNALIARYSLLAIERDKSSPVDLKENHSLETWDGVVNVNCKGTAVLVGHLQEPIETVKARDFDLLSFKASLVFSVQ